MTSTRKRLARGLLAVVVLAGSLAITVLLVVSRGAPGYFSQPNGLAVAPNGEVYAADGGSDAQIRRFAADGRYLGTLGPSLPRGVRLADATGIAIDRQGRIYVSGGPHAAVVVELSPEGRLIRRFYVPSPDPGPVAVGPDGRLFVSTAGPAPCHVYGFDPNGRLQAARPCATGTAPNRASLAIDGNELLETDLTGAGINRYAFQGRLLGRIAAGVIPRGAAGLAEAPDGGVVAVDDAGSRIVWLTRDGILRRTIPVAEVSYPAVAPGGTIYVFSHTHIAGFDGDGRFLGNFASAPLRQTHS